MKDYKWECVLYPASQSYDCDALITQMIEFWPEWLFIEHDRDKNDDGTLKDKHIHFYGRNPELTKYSPESLAKRFYPLQPKDFQHVKNWRSAVRYSRHLDDTSKAQYRADEVCANFYTESYWSKPDETEMAKAILQFIAEHGYCVSMSQMLDYVLSNNLYSAFRRGIAIWRSYVVSDNEYQDIIKMKGHI